MVSMIYFNVQYVISYTHTACLKGYYKSSQGNDLCEKCPDNSNSTTSGTTSCTCLTGYYRSRYEGVTTACTGEYHYHVHNLIISILNIIF